MVIVHLNRLSAPHEDVSKNDLHLEKSLLFRNLTRDVNKNKH